MSAFTFQPHVRKYRMSPSFRGWTGNWLMIPKLVVSAIFGIRSWTFSWARHRVSSTPLHVACQLGTMDDGCHNKLYCYVVSHRGGTGMSGPGSARTGRVS